MIGRFIWILLVLVTPLSAKPEFDGRRPGNVKLDGRDRPVTLPHNVYVKECQTAPDGRSALLLLYRYRSDDQTSSDYFSMLFCRWNGVSGEWDVHFFMNEAEMIERWKGDFRVIAIGELQSDSKAVLMVATPLPDRTDNVGAINWERWDISSEKQLKVLRTAAILEPYTKKEEEDK